MKKLVVGLCAFCIIIVFPFITLLELSKYQDVDLLAYILVVGGSIVYLTYYATAGIIYRIKEEQEKINDTRRL